MSYDRFLIAPYRSGIVNDLPTWLTLPESFKQLENANVFRGRIKKRFGADLIGDILTSRVRCSLGATDVTGAAAGTVPGNIFGTIGQLFSVGDQIFTVNQAGTPAPMLVSTGPGGGTYNTTTGAYVFAGVTPSTQVYWYPAQPIMGITHYESGSVNEHVTYAMDTQFIYKYSGTDWIRDTTFAGAFQGDNKQFFWSANYVGADAGSIALFTTNFNAITSGVAPASDDAMYFYNGTAWADFSAQTQFNSNQDFVASAKMILSWKNRLLLLNVIEQNNAAGTNSHIANRVRFSHNGSPIKPTAAGTFGHPWLERRQTYVSGATTYIGDGGGFIDLPTEQEIVSAAIVKDRFIVYCERSTWELAYTGNPAIPFVWKSIDISIGSESTYSTIPFDNAAITVATTGVYACDGISVNRIDKKIPDEIFYFLNTSEGTSRVHGIRDFYNGMAYWTFLENENSGIDTYPNKLMVLNYETGAWSFYDDCITTFGFFEQSSDFTWAYPSSWDTNDSWGSFYNQDQSRLIVAGNHQGYLFTLNNDKPENADVMTVADFNNNTFLVPDHNLDTGDFIQFNYDTISSIHRVNRTSSDEFYIVGPVITPTYVGGGTIKRVSKISIISKDWNPYVKTGDRVYLARIDFCVKNTFDGEATVYYSTDLTDLDLVNQGSLSGAQIGTNILEMHKYAIESNFSNYKDILWRSIYFQSYGDSISINISLSDDQMVNKDISLSNFELQGMILYTMKNGR